MGESLQLAFGLVVTAASALGYGQLAARFTRSDHNLAGDGVIGIAILTAIQMVEHFFVPLAPAVDLATLLPGVIAYALAFRRRPWLEFLVLGVTIWWSIQFSRTGPISYDHGLYHLQSAIWNTLEAAIPGISNLHTRLGFNSSLFVLAAGLRIPAMGGWSLAMLSSAILEAMIVCDVLLSIGSKEKIARSYSLIVVIFLLLEPRWLLEPTYISPDPVIALGVVYVVLLFLEKRVPAMLLCVPFLITVKLSAAPLLLMSHGSESFRKYRRAAIVGLLFLGIWVGRNVVLSGHLIFPVAATRLPVPWAEPRNRTQETAAWITSWARQRDASLEQTRGTAWIRPWLPQIVSEAPVRAVSWMVIAGIFLLAWTRVVSKRELARVDVRLFLRIAAGLLYWFIAAPTLRMGLGFMLATAFLALAYGAESLALWRLEPANAWPLTILLVSAMGLSAPRKARPEWPETQHPAVRLVSTPTGDRIWTPLEGDRCFAVIPCSPEPNTIRYYPRKARSKAPAP